MPNFGTRAAKASWLAPLAATLFFAIAGATGGGLTTASTVRTHLSDISEMCSYSGIVLCIVGFVSGVVALTTTRRYGPTRILRPAIVGLLLSLAVFPLFVALLALWIIFGQP